MKLQLPKNWRAVAGLSPLTEATQKGKVKRVYKYPQKLQKFLERCKNDR